MKLEAYGATMGIYQELQTSFDYGKIKYTDDYYDTDMNPDAEPTIPEWKVYFDGNFLGFREKTVLGQKSE